MRARLALISICVPGLLLTACGEGDDITPRDGAWSYDGSAAVDDTCMLDELAVDSPGLFTLSNNSDGSFTVNDTVNEFDCTLDGADFDCPSRSAGERDIGADYGLDAIVHYNIVAFGSFSSDTQMSGRQEITVTCEGADCPTLEALAMVTTPCGWAQPFTATAN